MESCTTSRSVKVMRRPRTTAKSTAKVMMPRPPACMSTRMTHWPKVVKRVPVSTTVRPVTHTAEVAVKSASRTVRASPCVAGGRRSSTVPAAIAAAKLATRTTGGESRLGVTWSASAEADAHQLADAWLLHGHAVELVRDLHGAARVGDQHELSLLLQALQHAHEAADVRVVERSIHLVEDAEGRGLVLEDREQQR